MNENTQLTEENGITIILMATLEERKSPSKKSGKEILIGGEG
jgi:hypothetical protein